MHTAVFKMDNLMYASLVAQLVNNLPAIWETWVRSLVWEDPLEKGIFPAQGLNPGLLHCRQIVYQLSHQGSSNNP